MSSGEDAGGEVEEGPGFRLVLGAPVAMRTGSIGAFGAVVACEEGLSGFRIDLPGIAISAVVPERGRMHSMIISAGLQAGGRNL